MFVKIVCTDLHQKTYMTDILMGTNCAHLLDDMLLMKNMKRFLKGESRLITQIRATALTWCIRCIHVSNLQFLYNVIC